MKNLIAALAAMILLLGITEEARPQDNGKKGEVLKEYTLFDVEEPSWTDITDGYLPFQVILKKNGEKEKGFFKINPRNLKIEVRADGRNVTTFKTAATNELALGLKIFDATLLVPNKEDQKSWRDYVAKNQEHYKLNGKIKSTGFAVIEINETKIAYFCIYTDFQPDWMKEGTDFLKNFNINKVATDAYGLSVVIDAKKAQEGVSFDILWGDYIFLENFVSKNTVAADRVTIFVKDQSEKEEWEQSIKKWKKMAGPPKNILPGEAEKTEPHRVLPPD